MKIQLIKTDQFIQTCYYVRVDGQIVAGSITNNEVDAKRIYKDLVEKKRIIGICQVLEETIIE
jgi:hypothetical protein